MNKAKVILLPIVFLVTLIAGLLYFIIQSPQSNAYYVVNGSGLYSEINYDYLSLDPIISSIKRFKLSHFSGVKEIIISFRVKVESLNGSNTIFQTAPENDGIKLLLKEPHSLILNIRTNLNNRFKTIDLTNNFLLNDWHKILIKIDRFGWVMVKIDQDIILDKKYKFLDYYLTKVLIGGEYQDENIQLMHGQIDDFSLNYKVFKKRKIAKVFEIVAMILLGIFLYLLVLKLKIIKFFSKIYQSKLTLNKQTILKYKRSNFWLAILISNLIVGVYNLLFFNRFFPITDGLWSLTARYILSGKMPYRDFHVYVPPLFPLKIAGFVSLFGYDFIYLRILGIFAMLAMTTLLFLIFVRFVPAYTSAIVTVLVMVVFQSHNILPTYDYTVFGFIYIFLSTVLFYNYLDFQRKRLNFWKFNLFLCGIFVSLLFLTKQNYGGLFIFTFIFLIVLINRKRALWPLVIYLAGLVLPLVIVLVWLIKNQALVPFIQQVFFDALSSKGGMYRVFFAWFFDLFKNNMLVLCGTLLFVFLLYKRKFNLFNTVREDIFGVLVYKMRLLIPVVLFVLCLLAVVFPLFNEGIIRYAPVCYIAEFMFVIVPITMIFVFICLILFLSNYLFKKYSSKTEDLLVFFIISLVVILCGATACGGVIFPYSIQLPLGLLFGLFIASKNISSKIRFFFAGVAFLMIINASNMKLNDLYNWFVFRCPSVKESVYSAKKIKYLNGFYMDRESVEVFSKINEIVQKNTSPGDTIFSFPYMPVFYLMNDRYPATFAFLHWYDSTSDNLCHIDALRLRKIPPKVIILWNDKRGKARSFHEALYRGKKESSQREIDKVISDFTCDYGTYELNTILSLRNDTSIEIWSRI